MNKLPPGWTVVQEENWIGFLSCPALLGPYVYVVRDEYGKIMGTSHISEQKAIDWAIMTKRLKDCYPRL